MSTLVQKHLYLLCSFFLVFILGCSNSYIDQVDRGGGYKFRPGYPELRTVATGFIDDQNQAYINIASEIVYGSLVFKKKDSLYVAQGTVDYQILDLSNPQNIVSPLEDPIEISAKSNNISYDQSTYKFEKNINVKPGNYEVIVTFTDASTNRNTTRVSTLFIPDPTNNVSNVTNIRILTKSDKLNSNYIPVTTYDIQSDVDSVKFVFQITNNIPDGSLTINSKLLRFEADTSIARPMNYINYTPSSIEYKGIDYSESEEINTNRRVLTTKGNVFIEFIFPKLPRGNYRFEVSSALGTDDEIYKARDFSIKSPNYPSLKTARELARPLYYLMTEDEYKDLMKIESETELKKAMDRFWLSNIENSQIAKGVVELFYERVEEANKQFSNYKEGWKTDRGMMYILFGPPWYYETRLDVQTWHYTYNKSDFERVFMFETPKIKNKFYPFNNYILQRNSAYYNIQFRQIELWKSGVILRRL